MAKVINWISLVALLALVLLDQTRDVPLWTYITLGLLFLLVQVFGSAVLSAQFYLPVFSTGGKMSNEIALTFDDGPVPDRTEGILDILKHHNVPATFFCIGKHVEAHPQIVRRMHEEGHLVANHSYFHRATFDLQSAAAIATELNSTDLAITRVVGSRPRFFRPPYGVTNPMVATAVRNGNYLTIGWSIRSFDTVIEDRTRLLRRLTRSLSGGDIILLHDQGKCTTDVLSELIQQVTALGLRIVRVDKLINEKGYEQV